MELSFGLAYVGVGKLQANKTLEVRKACKVSWDVYKDLGLNPRTSTFKNWNNVPWEIVEQDVYVFYLFSVKSLRFNTSGVVIVLESYYLFFKCKKRGLFRDITVFLKS